MNRRRSQRFSWTPSSSSSSSPSSPHQPTEKDARFSSTHRRHLSHHLSPLSDPHLLEESYRRHGEMSEFPARSDLCARTRSLLSRACQSPPHLPLTEAQSPRHSSLSSMEGSPSCHLRSSPVRYPAPEREERVPHLVLPHRISALSSKSKTKQNEVADSTLSVSTNADASPPLVFSNSLEGTRIMLLDPPLSSSTLRGSHRKCSSELLPKAFLNQYSPKSFTLSQTSENRVQQKDLLEFPMLTLSEMKSRDIEASSPRNYGKKTRLHAPFGSSSEMVHQRKISVVNEQIGYIPVNSPRFSTLKSSNSPRPGFGSSEKRLFQQSHTRFASSDIALPFLWSGD